MLRTLALTCCLALSGAVATAGETLHMVVMDPLAAPLSCPCVEGYAQRKYEVLAAYLERELGAKITVSFGETLTGGLKDGEVDKCHIIVGKDSVIRAHTKQREWKATPLAMLTGKDGVTTQTGLIVVRSDDPAKTVSDLAGYRILYGPPDCDEKFSAARKLLSDTGVEVVAAEAAETTVACSDGACKIIEWGDSERAAAVISSYAAPLLEGCGTIQKGELRVVGETKPVPFVAAYATEHLPDELRPKLKEALLGVATHADVLIALETLNGFVDPFEFSDPAHEPVFSPPGNSTDQFDPDTPQAWNGFRGPSRDGHAAWLPKSLPDHIPRVWSVPLVHAGLGGIAATEQYVVLGDRDATNMADQWRCYDAATGTELWKVTYPAPGQLDYDNFPRATPLIDGGRVFLFGAFGHLTCADLATGDILWQSNLSIAFGPTEESVWGYCSSPLLVDGKLIVNPGAPAAALVALDANTGLPIWQSAGRPAAYGSFILASLGGKRQIIGYDETTLGGWDPATGQRLWTYTPPGANDFNVPTPTVAGERLVLVTENNSTRIMQFANDGTMSSEPVGTYRDLAADMSTPVVIGNRIFCVSDALFCLEIAGDGSLHEVYAHDDDAFVSFAPIIASDDRLLIAGLGGELLLVDATADEFRVVSRQHVFDASSREADIYPHPAIVGTRLYVRGEQELVCLELGGS